MLDGQESCGYRSWNLERWLISPRKKSLSNCTAPEAILQHGCLKKSERLFGWHFTRPGQAVHVEKLRKTTGRGNVPSWFVCSPPQTNAIPALKLSLKKLFPRQDTIIQLGKDLNWRQLTSSWRCFCRWTRSTDSTCSTCCEWGSACWSRYLLHLKCSLLNVYQENEEVKEEVKGPGCVCKRFFFLLLEPGSPQEKFSVIPKLQGDAP